jgi:beta-mannosidase
MSTERPNVDQAESHGEVAVPGYVQTHAGFVDLWTDVPELTKLNHDEWVYVCTFDVPPIRPGQRAVVGFAGVDYFCDVWINGDFVMHHEGAFSTFEVDITDHVHAAGLAELTLAVSCPWAPDDRTFYLQPSTVFSVILTNTEYMKGNLLHYWDGLPLSGQTVFPFGIWRDVSLEIRDTVQLVAVDVATSVVTADRAVLDVTLTWSSRGNRAIRIPVTIALTDEGPDPTAVTELIEVVVEPGDTETTVRTSVPNPKLWWTWDTGIPHLYFAEATAGSASVRRRFGIRVVHRDPQSLAYYINGQRLFLRGSWYPFANIFPGLASDEECVRDVEMLRDANHNHIVSFTFIEREALYDACDEAGILVFQELPFTQLGPMKVVDPDYPRYRDHWEWAVDQVANIVRQRRSHPSVVVWGAFAETQKRSAWVWGDYTEFVEALREVVVAADPDSIFHPSFCDFGEEHIWNGGFPFGEFWDHYDRNHFFISEFGGISPPAAETLNEFIPPSKSWGLEERRSGRLQLPIDVEEFSYRWAFDYAGLATSVARMYRHALTDPRTLTEFLDAIQWYQALGLQYCAEVYRRKRFADICGARTWSYRENTPGIKFTVVDHRQRPKMGYFALQAAYAPVLLSVDEQHPLKPLDAGSRYTRNLWAVNDTTTSIDLDITAHLYDSSGVSRWTWSGRCSALADSGQVVASLEIEIPATAGNYLLRIEGVAEGRLVAKTERWLRVVAPAFESPIHLLLIGQRRYCAPILDGLEDVASVNTTVLDETSRDVRDHSWTAGLTGYDAIWFAGWDTAVHRFRRSEWQGIVDAVRGGTGFIHTGGQASFHGGDGRGAQLDATPLAEILPVTMQPHDGVWDIAYACRRIEHTNPLFDLPLEEMPYLGMSRTVATEAATVHWEIGDWPLLVTSAAGNGAVALFTAALSKPLRMFRIGEGLEWEDPLDVEPHWARDDIRKYGAYWRHITDLALALVASVTRRELGEGVVCIADALRKPLYEAILRETPATTLDVKVVDVRPSAGVLTAWAMVTNTGSAIARLVRGVVVGSAGSNHRFRDGFVDLLPGETTKLRFEAEDGERQPIGIEVSAQNVPPVMATLSVRQSP